MRVTSYFTSKWKKSDKNGRKCSGKRIPPTVNENDNPKGLQFSAILDLRISHGKGVIQVLDDKKLRVEGSDWALFDFRLCRRQRSSHRRKEHEESDRGIFLSKRRRNQMF
jgi:hypothetical protein